MFRDIFSKFYKRELSDMSVNKDLKKKIAEKLEIDSVKNTAQPKPFGLNPFIGFAAIGALVIILAVIVWPEKTTPTPLVFGEKTDDWQYDEAEVDDGGFFGNLGFASKGRSFVSSLGTSSGAPMMAESLDSDSLGFSVGGAKDVESFRQNIENGYLPLADSITYEGLFYEYFFDTGKNRDCKDLFCPSYARAVSKDPISNEEEYYLSVGLNSNLTEEDFERKKLNLVIVLDISGSMGSPFDQYYYDAMGNPVPLSDFEYSNKSKMEVANESVVALLEHLNDDDRVGIVLFDDVAHTAKPVRYVGETDMNALEGHILEIAPQGGTNMQAGIDEATKLLDEFKKSNLEEYENRIIFLTDAMPNLGDYSEGGLVGQTQRNSQNNIYTTFIGIGVDFQSELIETLTKTRGANYYSVHSADEFAERMDEGFEYMVTPLVFDLELSVEADGFDIEQVYGSPEADEATGEIMQVKTLFPSKTEDGETRGGLVLLKLKKTSDDGKLTLSASYTDRSGKKHQSVENIEFKNMPAGSYDNTGIRKGILLSRFVDLVKNWIIDERESIVYGRPVEPTLNEETGIISIWQYPEGSRWEQTSLPLTVSPEYKKLFESFRNHFESELKAIGDVDLSRELDIMDKILSSEQLPDGFPTDDIPPDDYREDDWRY